MLPRPVAAASEAPPPAATPPVSVIVPAHDAAATLPETLESLVGQSFAGFEAVIVDDGSTDGTAAVVAELSARDPRFGLVSLPSRSGVSAARNAGLASARGEWVLFLDADDRLLPDHLANLTSTVAAGSDGAVSGYRFVPEAGGEPGPPIRPDLGTDLFRRTAEGCPFPIHACLVRRRDVLDLGGFDTGLEVGEDWDLWQRFGRAGKKLAATDGATAVYRLRAGSATRRSARLLDDGLEVIGRAHAPDPRVADAVPAHADGLPRDELADNRAPFLRTVLGRRLGAGAPVDDVLARLAPGPRRLAEPDEIVGPVADGFLQGAGCLPVDVPTLWPARAAVASAILDTVGRELGEPDLGPALVLALLRRLVDALPPGALPATIGGLQVVGLDPRRRWSDLTVPESVEVVRVRLTLDGEARRPFDVPTEAGGVTAAAIAGAVVAAHGQALGRRILDGWRRDPKRAARLARRLSRPRGRRFLAHLLTLPRAERGRATRAFVAEALPTLLPGLAAARGRGAAGKGAAGDGPLGGPGWEDWEVVFTAENPFDYESGYERAKYEHTLKLLPEGPIGRALELACAEGHFTVLLAPRVAELLATDISPTAAARAAERCRDLPGVRTAVLDLVRDPIPPGFDLVVVSEVFYYLKDRRELAEVARRIAAALPAGGHLLTTHASLLADDPASTGFDWEAGFGAKAIGEGFAALPDLEFVKELRTPLYRVALFRKRATPARGPSLPGEILEREPVWPVLPRVAGGVVRGGAVVTRKDANGTLVTRRLPILMYHRVASDGPDALATWRVPPERFEAQLDWLKRHGFRSVGLDGWLEALDRRFGELHGRAVCLTFDDGYEDFAEIAWPLLKRYGFGATVFLPSGLVGGRADWDRTFGEPAPLMGWDTIGALAREGVVFGAHTVSHPALTRVGPRRMRDELARSRGELENRLGRPADTLAYPFGFHDDLVRNTAAAAGFRAAVTTRHARARLGDDLLALPRLKVAGEDDLESFARMLDLKEQAGAVQRLRYWRARRRGEATWR